LYSYNKPTHDLQEPDMSSTPLKPSQIEHTERCIRKNAAGTTCTDGSCVAALAVPAAATRNQPKAGNVDISTSSVIPQKGKAMTTTLAPTTDLVFLQNKNGIRAHRATCKRVPAQVPHIDFNLLIDAIPATCCRPNKSQVAAVALEAANASVSAEAATRAEYAASSTLTDIIKNIDEVQASKDAVTADAAHAADAADAVAVADDTAYADAVARVVYYLYLSEAKVSKHYWQAFGVTGARMVAAAFDVEVDIDDKAMSVGFSGEYATEAKEALLTLWLNGFAAFKTWRRTDEAYRALPSQDTHWYTSERYAREQAWLRAHVADEAAGYGVAAESAGLL